MELEIQSFVVGLLIGVIATVALATPRIGCIMARIAATIALAAGVGGLVWAIDALRRDVTVTPIGWAGLYVGEPGEALGWSAGLLAAGVTVLVLSFLGSSHSD